MTMGTWHATGTAGWTSSTRRSWRGAVSEWAKADLEECGYPAWDGVDGGGPLGA